MDSNGDGIGDMRGLIRKLDYLRDLGVTAIWLLPFYPSPLRDDGYDISDYYTINPNYGDIETFKKLVAEAHRRGLKVITELVINHTSDQHPWFQRARKSPKDSNYRNYYVWSDDPDKFKDARIIFTDYEPSNWTWDSDAQSYYWHRFFHHQPDLNFDNPEVQQEIFNILDYWIELGVDGFRLDAIPYLFERDGTNCENLPETHVFLKKLRKHVDEKYDDVMFLAEANMWPEDSVSYFGDGDECHMNYHFPIMPRLFMSLKMEDRYPVIDIIDQTPAIPENCQWAIFLRNHDELTLEMVTDEERDYMYKVYTKDSKAKINVGIRQRLAPLLDNNKDKIELMNILLFSLPGTPVIYYGDEIGMGDNYYLGDRDGVRTPMQWSPDRNAGFSMTNPQRLYLPVIIDPAYSYESVNVETQSANPSSLLWWMKRTIKMRKKFKAFSRGDIEFLSPSNSRVLAFTRTFEDETILVVTNLSRYSQYVDLDLEKYSGYRLVEVFSQNSFPEVKNDTYPLTLSPYGYFWFAFQQEHEKTGNDILIPELDISNWEELKETNIKEQLENEALPAFLKKTTWFNRYQRKIQSYEIKDFVDTSVEEENSAMILLEVTFSEGLPERYLINSVYIPAYKTDAIENMEEWAIISKLHLANESGYLMSSEYSSTYMTRFFEHFLENKEIRNGRLEAAFKSKLSPKDKLYEDLHSPRIINSIGYNTTIYYGQDFVIKLYRQVDDVTNPDVEITRHLSENTEFEQVGQFMGAAYYYDSKGEERPFAMLQKFIPNQGTAWNYLNQSVKGFYDKLSIHLSQSASPSFANKVMAREELKSDWDELLEGDLIDQVKLLGTRTAQLHAALASIKEKDFKPEPFSLHYQRSLYSGFKSITRSSFQRLKKHLPEMDEELRNKASQLLTKEKDILDILKRVYQHKFETLKIRNHGDLRLSNILWTGNDFTFIDFEGDGKQSFSQRRIKRSPLRDVAILQRSFHYAAFNTLVKYDFTQFDDERLPVWAEKLYHELSDDFFEAYEQEIGRHEILPAQPEDREILQTTYLLERMLLEMGTYSFENPAWWTVPINGLESVIFSFSE
jgi:maltose alpha-D-glucosyltransferase/alpha-amylase